MVSCTNIPQRKIFKTEDIILSKEDWNTSYDECAALHFRLVEWLSKDKKQ